MFGYYVSSNQYVRYYVTLPPYLICVADRLMDSSISTTGHVMHKYRRVFHMISPVDR